MEYQLTYSKFVNEGRNLCQDLFEDTNFTDVTIVCGDARQFKAHRVILSSSSSLFKNILVQNSHPNPLLYFHNIEEKQMELLMKFIYTGETKVVEEDLDALLEVADKLKINGLANTRETSKVLDKGIIESEIILDSNETESNVKDRDGENSNEIEEETIDHTNQWTMTLKQLHSTP